MVAKVFFVSVLASTLMLVGCTQCSKKAEPAAQQAAQPGQQTQPAQVAVAAGKLEMTDVTPGTGAVAERTSELHRLPDVAEPGQLQSGTGHAAGPGNEVERSK